MDAFLVRKRPFEEHAKMQQQQQRQRPKLAANYTSSLASSAAAAASSSYAPSRSSSSSSSYSRSSLKTVPPPALPSFLGSAGSTLGGGRIQASFDPEKTYVAPTKQITIDSMKKTNHDVDRVNSIRSSLESCSAREDWAGVLRGLNQLKGMFISKDVLAKTKIGLVVAKLKHINDGTNLQRDIVDISMPGEEKTEAKRASPSAEAATEDVVDLTHENKENAHHDAANASASSPLPPFQHSPNSAARLTLVALAHRLVEEWKKQVRKEEDAARAPPAFSDHSTFKERCSSYKSLYYKLSDTDRPETQEQRTERRKTMQPLVPKDWKAAELAIEIESAVFKHHHQKLIDVAERQRKLRGAELLSATPTDGPTAPDIVTTLPPLYTPHARAVSFALSNPDRRAELLHSLNAPSPSPTAAAAAAAFSSSSSAPSAAESRKDKIMRFILSAK